MFRDSHNESDVIVQLTSFLLVEGLEIVKKRSGQQTGVNCDCIDTENVRDIGIETLL